MSRTFSNKVRVRGSHKRAARNEGRPRIGQIRVKPNNMPHTMFRKAWMADGTQVAIARSNDRFICGHFDARENPLSPAAVFEGGGAENKALTWLKRMKTICA
tara:strand:- start:82 stop:387 length:306 start_codon:yes stop_codon:yes gene_type:complete